MLDFAARAVVFCDGKSVDDLRLDNMRLLAVLKAVETVGEASTSVSAHTRGLLPNIDWWKIRRARNRMIHGYDSIDVAVVLDTVRLSLPPLIEELRRFLNDPPAPEQS